MNLNRFRILCLFNLLVLFLYLLLLDIHSIHFTRFLYVLFLMVLASAVFGDLSRWVSLPLRLSQAWLGSTLVLFLLFELLFRIVPSSVPYELSGYLESDSLREEKDRAVEFLIDSPYAKFRPNRVVRSQGSRGSKKQFTYEWKTDALGFKNDPTLLNSEEIEAIAVGDSFTEGMGVALEKIWTSLLSARGVPTYNLGVQGYAPSQMASAFLRYGKPMHPKTILIGYCGQTFIREANMLGPDTAPENRITGGIKALADSERGHSSRVRTQARFVSSALFLLARDLFKRPRYREEFFGVDTGAQRVRPKYRPYEKEILRVGHKRYLIEKVQKNSSEWQSTLAAFDKILKDRDGARVILLYFPHREEMYYEAATGLPVPAVSLEKIESHLLRKYAYSKGIEYLDLSDVFLQYVTTLTDATPISEFPYLEIDGHMSAQGHQLVAKALIALLRPTPQQLKAPT